MSRMSALVGWALLLTRLPASGDEGRSMIATGNDLLTTCNSTANIEWGMCMGYILGVTNGAKITAPKFICVPTGVTHGQMRDVVVTYIKDHAAQRHLDGATLALMGLNAAFPCPKN